MHVGGKVVVVLLLHEPGGRQGEEIIPFRVLYVTPNDGHVIVPVSPLMGVPQSQRVTNLVRNHVHLKGVFHKKWI